MSALNKRCDRCEASYQDWLARKRPKLGRPKKPTIPSPTLRVGPTKSGDLVSSALRLPIVNMQSLRDRREKICKRLADTVLLTLSEILREGPDDWPCVNEAQPYSASVSDAIQNKRRDMEALAFVLEGYRGKLMMASHRLDLYRSKKEREASR